ncbi:MAG: hypothetical protein JNG83_06790 [Opitutaceae bacterium]|nr:hypothetical protein [Opitutaceae bacterium]
MMALSTPRGILATFAFVVLAGFLAGCVSDPMTYEQWKKEQEKKRQATEAGVEYKSPAQIRAEAKSMKEETGDTTFSKSAK